MSIVELSDLLPGLAGVRVEGVVTEDAWVRVRASADGLDARCPGCGGTSQRVHSRYERFLHDPALGGRATTIGLTVRRFFCDTADCRRKTFVEQVSGLTVRHARHSIAARAVLLAVALALGGRAGARLTGWLAMPTGRMSLLRLIRAMPEPVVPTPQALGVDDFALRRGHVYATILIDMDTRRPIDVLPDRTKDTLAAWLAEHPGVEVICRDRSGAYAEGAHIGAPDAIQVADRWHLWRNLGDAVETVVVAHRADLVEPIAEPDLPIPSPAPDPIQPPVERAETGLAVRTRERYAAVQELLTASISRAGVSRRLQLDPHTVRRFADAATVDELLVNTRRDSLIDDYRTYLHQRWNEGCTDATVLYQEIRQLGFTGSDKTVRRYVHPLRASIIAPPVAPTPPKTRHVARWIMTDPANLDPDDKSRLDAISDRSPAIRTLIGHVRDFATMMRKLAGNELPQWIKRVEDDPLPGLHTFTNGVKRDLAAVTNGLTLPWSSGPVEGQVNRIKMIKRQMYGRANLDLLRRRILAPI
jgi:transposase